MSSTRDTDRARASIRDALTVIQQCFLEGQISAQNGVNRGDAARTQLQESASRVRVMIEEMEEKLRFLQKHRYEELSVSEGDPNPSFERRGLFALTPDFHFALKTKWPIRTVLVDPPPSPSRWLNFPSYNNRDSYEFIATLKNKRTTSASAQVRLYGWRDEIHAEEIVDCKATIAALREEQDRVKRRTIAEVINVQQARARRDAYDVRLSLVERDIQLLARRPLPLDADGNTVQNLYALCKGYMLVTTIERADLPSNVQEKYDAPLCLSHLGNLRDLQQCTSGLLTEVESQCEDLQKTAKDDTSFFKSSLREYAVRLAPNNLNYLSKLAAEGKPAGDSIALQALKAIEDLDERTSAYITRQVGLFEMLHEERDMQPDLAEWDPSIQDSMSEIVGYNGKDLEATETTYALFNAPEIRIAEVAYLLANESAIQGWTAILDAVIEDAEIQIPPLQDTVINESETKKRLDTGSAWRLKGPGDRSEPSGTIRVTPIHPIITSTVS